MAATYNFKRIAPVPTNTDFVDIVLSRTQRKTPTVVHAAFSLSRIRDFYMRKVKFTQTTFHEKLSAIVDEFPKLDEIHPFYADLVNVLYDRDHYKLALGQVNTARQLIDNVAKDYVKMLKYGDSLFRCKQLKRAALGRMVTIMRKQGPTLKYLEGVRQHLARLPAIDPNTRTLLVCGFPNVGKSSFMNKVTRAQVDVQPYAFTTKSLFVGHMDYKYNRWQVIDTPGILDHPLEERNPIEMQSITALAHLHCAVLFFVDISTKCGASIEDQLSLFANISPLFINKPVVLVATKTDQQPWATLDDKYKEMILGAASKAGALFASMSNFTEEGVVELKAKACEALIARRLDMKAKNSRKTADVLNRVTVTLPKPRDGKVREATIPPAVLAARAAKAAMGAAATTTLAPERAKYASVLSHLAMARADPALSIKLLRDAAASGGSGAAVSAGGEDEDMGGRGGGGGGGEDDMNLPLIHEGTAPMLRRWLERDREAAGGGPGVYRTDTIRYWDLKDPEWKTDFIPEIMDGKNIADYVDPDIEEKLLALEAEEEAMLAEEAAAAGELDDAPEDAEQAAMFKAVMEKKKALRLASHAKKDHSRPPMPRTTAARTLSASAVKAKFAAKGLPAEAGERYVAHARELVAGSKRGRSRSRATAGGDADEDMTASAAGGAGKATLKTRGRSRTRREVGGSGTAMDVDEDEGVAAAPATKRARARSASAALVRAASERAASRARSRTRDTSAVDPHAEGLKDAAQVKKASKLLDRLRRKQFMGKGGETDRHIGTKMPKHLYSGKRGIGSNDWR